MKYYRSILVLRLEQEVEESDTERLYAARVSRKTLDKYTVDLGISGSY